MKPKRTLHITGAVLALAASVTAQAISLESAPPVVVKTVPVAGATDVDPALTEIKVTYSKAMQDGSWSWSTWGKENYPETTGEPRYLQDGRTCVQPVRLEPNKFYALWLNSQKFKGFQDTSGQPAVPYLLTFFTGDSAMQAADLARPPDRRSSSDRIRQVVQVGKFVRLVLSKDQMTFEGMPVTRDQLEARLAEIPDRGNTGLELAVTPDALTGEVSAIQALAGKLSQQLGFKCCNLSVIAPLGSKGGQKFQAANSGEQYLQQQLKQAEAGNYWAKFRLWEAYSKGKHDVNINPAEAAKWLSELVKGAYLAKFEPVNGFAPKTPQEMLANFNESCRLRSERESLGGASFFRTTKQGDKLIGSFLTETPDEFKAALGKNPKLKLISMEKATPEMFLAHESARQESL